MINVTGRNHPMHLHGAYFTVDARGDQLRGAFPRRAPPPHTARIRITVR